MFPFTPLENFGFDFVKYHDLSSKIVNNICGINTVNLHIDVPILVGGDSVHLTDHINKLTDNNSGILMPRLKVA